MRQDELISVIVPVYNVEKYIDKCIKSIISQDYTNLEIWLVDDGSTDSSGEVCDKYAESDQRIIVIHKDNGGLSDARNVALDRMQGKYVLFIDSDDYIEKNYISYLYMLLKDYQSDISICNFKYVNEKGQILNNPEDTGKIVQYSKEEALDKILQGKEINTSASMKLYCCDIFKNIRYPKGKLYEDVATTYKTILRANRVVYGDYSGYVYLCRGGSITKRKFTEKRMDAIYNMEEMCSNIIKAYPNLQGKCMVRLFEQYVSVYSAAKNSTGNKIIEKQIFGKLKDMRKRANVRGKNKVYSISIAIGKWLFDTIILVENSIQRYRKKI